MRLPFPLQHEEPIRLDDVLRALVTAVAVGGALLIADAAIYAAHAFGG